MIRMVATSSASFMTTCLIFFTFTWGSFSHA
jgi:hypothetical protein